MKCQNKCVRCFNCPVCQGCLSIVQLADSDNSNYSVFWCAHCKWDSSSTPIASSGNTPGLLRHENPEKLPEMVLTEESRRGNGQQKRFRELTDDLRDRLQLRDLETRLMVVVDNKDHKEAATLQAKIAQMKVTVHKGEKPAPKSDIETASASEKIDGADSKSSSSSSRHWAFAKAAVSFFCAFYA